MDSWPAKEGGRAAFVELIASQAVDTIGVPDRIPVLDWRQDAHSMEGLRFARLDKPLRA
jgi:hypothetical protein